MRKALLVFILTLLIGAMLGPLNYSKSSAAVISKSGSQLPVLKKEQLANVIAQLQEAPVFAFQLHPVTKSFGLIAFCQRGRQLPYPAVYRCFMTGGKSRTDRSHFSNYYSPFMILDKKYRSSIE